MAITLETLDLGTPVFVGQQHVGDVTGLYAEGDARSVELLSVAWLPTGENVAIPASEVENVDDHGVQLMHGELSFYAELTVFSEARFPTVRKLK